MSSATENTRGPETGARSYAQFCGVAAGLDVIGDRWALLVVRDLLLGPLRFGDLADGLPGIGTNTLTARLKQLEAGGIVARHLRPRPERGTVYELTDYGRELEPILLALGRWGERSMYRVPPDAASRSRWLVVALLAFYDPDRATPTRRLEPTPRLEPTTWELRLDDGAFALQLDHGVLGARAGAPSQPDVVIEVADQDLHRLLIGDLEPARAIADGAVTIEGDVELLVRLVDLCAFV